MTEAILKSIREELQAWATATPSSLPHTPEELQYLSEDVDRAVTVWSNVIDGFGVAVDAMELEHNAKLVDPSSELAKFLGVSLDQVILRAQAKLDSSPLFPRTLHAFMNGRLRLDLAQSISQILDGVCHVLKLVAEFHETRKREAFDVQMAALLEVGLPLGVALAQFRRGFVDAPPTIPPRLMKYVSGLADILEKDMRDPRLPAFECADLDDGTDDEDWEDDNSRSSSEIKSAMLQCCYEMLAQCELSRRIYVSLRREISTSRNKLDVQIHGVSKSRRAKGDVNLKMLQAIQEDPTLIKLSVEQWKIRLSCSKSTVQNSRTWTMIMQMREQARRERDEPTADE